VYEVAWALLHAVESAPYGPELLQQLDDRSPWVKYLRERAVRGGMLPPHRTEHGLKRAPEKGITTGYRLHRVQAAAECWQGGQTEDSSAINAIERERRRGLRPVGTESARTDDQRTYFSCKDPRSDGGDSRRDGWHPLAGALRVQAASERIGLSPVTAAIAPAVLLLNMRASLRRAVLTALFGMLIMTACAADRPPDSSIRAPTRCEVDDGTAAALEPLVTDKVPAGYERAPDAAEDTGPTNLSLAASFVGDPREQAVLSAFRYRRGYQRLWYPPDGGGNDLIVHLYEFCDAKGAAGYLRHTRERLLSPLWGSVEIDADLPGPEVALLQKGDSSGESFGAVLRDHGRFYVEVGAYGGPPGEEFAALFARAGALNAAQVAELP
jgi:hypothetical protein